ncbi:alpha-D-ribose 1-methylphosphonate 5-phosphate C-P-lyase PhnJ [Caldicellulosiruptor morganii]|uniref:Alpha-D-ribose 1-methylphosphonate 5-phosphate C-P-lyase PhnJ n=1 Tax=Caldicellulosiruptor morganii TaxID=1387555 RepID=A0ABY7BKV4_9FIRM|nr:alpha-D-ribose 1-methylphosphonate 5-phosphate C-P-lyase PhnJ [Caldicellulosiruptor morganii]WAM33477.1 alpha-D-ribose 1-methylphosphonate 5-phosphate C-P-lyase PhnJ [Caldicellulosiruptor morganii]
MENKVNVYLNTSRYNFGFLNEEIKKEIRRKILKAVAIPGYQVPFASQELPIAKGWGTGGLQITFSLVGRDDIVKIIDQGCDESVNAVNLKRLIVKTTGVKVTTDTYQATIIQTRHRIPEIELNENQILVFQVPIPEPLRIIEPSEIETRRMHAEMDYGKMWVYLYEDIIKWGDITIGYRYPVLVNNRYIMDPSPIPRWDIPKLNMAKALFLFGAGREKRIYAVPPYTKVKPLEFEDYKFHVENFNGKKCSRCGSSNSFLVEYYNRETGEKTWVCSDTSYCTMRLKHKLSGDEYE